MRVTSPARLTERASSLSLKRSGCSKMRSSRCAVLLGAGCAHTRHASLSQL